jgi:hypothetical protein
LLEILVTPEEAQAAAEGRRTRISAEAQ